MTTHYKWHEGICFRRSLASILVITQLVAIAALNTHGQRQIIPQSIQKSRLSAGESLTPAATRASRIGSLRNGALRFSGSATNQQQFQSHVNGYALFLTETGVALIVADQSQRHQQWVNANSQFRKADQNRAMLQMRLIGAKGKPRLEGLQPLGIDNYLIGNQRKKWRTNLRSYARVKFAGIYAGVDVVYYGTQKQLEYDFVVAPDADPAQMVLEVSSAAKLEIDPAGDLLLKSSDTQLRQLKPFIYQEVDGKQQPISGGYVLKGKNRFGFQVGRYDHSKPLVIDPVLVFSTYLGGGGDDEGAAVTTDFEGNAYVVGTTNSANFPISNGAAQPTPGSGKDVFITKMKPNGSIAYSTYLGGSLDDYGYGIAVDSAGNAYITGTTASTDFPTKTGALQTANGGGTDAFVAKLDPTGSKLLYSTYLGGGGNEEVGSSRVDLQACKLEYSIVSPK